MKIRMIRLLSFFSLSIVNLLISQNDFELEDLNPNSEFFGQMIGPNTFFGEISIVYFGHEY